jgi:flagellar basal body rod protein FlgB
MELEKALQVKVIAINISNIDTVAFTPIGLIFHKYLTYRRTIGGMTRNLKA